MNSEKIDFSTPQSLSTGGFWVHALMQFWKILKNVIFVFLYVIVKYFEQIFTWQFWAVLGGLIVIFIIIAYISHRKFKYWIDWINEEIILEKGILNRSKTVLKFENIQQINIKQNIIQQALDIYSVEIESAGSSGKEMELYALDEHVAHDLKSQINQYALGLKGQGMPEISLKETDSDILFKIPAKNILTISLFTNYGQGIALFFAFLITTFESLKDFISWDTLMEHGENLGSSITVLSLNFLIGFLLILLIPIIINLFKYFIRYFNFSMKRESNGNIVMNYGLFEVNELLLNREKVQKIQITNNWILNKLNLYIISLHQVVTDVKAENSIIVIPGANRKDKESVQNILFRLGFYESKQTIKPKINLFFMRFFMALLFCSAIGGYLYLVKAEDWQFALFIIVSILVLISQYVYYRNYSMEIREDVIIKSSGIWDITKTIVSIDKIRTVEVSQSFIQKTSKTGDLQISTASGIVEFAYFDIQHIRLLSNELVLEIEIL